jgi:hypothetical protein
LKICLLVENHNISLKDRRTPHTTESPGKMPGFFVFLVNIGEKMNAGMV